MKNVVILFGMPGSGKGTQSVKVGERYGISAITTGEILREEATQDVDLKKDLAGGSLIPDEKIEEFLEEKIDSMEGSSFIFDGFPRTLSQLKAYNILEKEHGIRTLPVYIEVSPGEATRRLDKRYVCEKCRGSSYEPGVCQCGGDLIRRSDDHPEVIEHRLQVFLSETMPVIEHYKKQGNLITINGEGTQDAVSERIYEKLDGYLKK